MPDVDSNLLLDVSDGEKNEALQAAYQHHLYLKLHEQQPSWTSEKLTGCVDTAWETLGTHGYSQIQPAEWDTIVQDIISKNALSDQTKDKLPQFGDNTGTASAFATFVKEVAAKIDSTTVTDELVAPILSNLASIYVLLNQCNKNVGHAAQLITQLQGQRLCHFSRQNIKELRRQITNGTPIENIPWDQIQQSDAEIQSVKNDTVIGYLTANDVATGLATRERLTTLEVELVLSHIRDQIPLDRKNAVTLYSEVIEIPRDETPENRTAKLAQIIDEQTQAINVAAPSSLSAPTARSSDDDAPRQISFVICDGTHFISVTLTHQSGRFTQVQIHDPLGESSTSKDIKASLETCFGLRSEESSSFSSAADRHAASLCSKADTTLGRVTVHQTPVIQREYLCGDLVCHSLVTTHKIPVHEYDAIDSSETASLSYNLRKGTYLIVAKTLNAQQESKGLSSEEKIDYVTKVTNVLPKAQPVRVANKTTDDSSDLPLPSAHPKKPIPQPATPPVASPSPTVPTIENGKQPPTSSPAPITLTGQHGLLTATVDQKDFTMRLTVKDPNADAGKMKEDLGTILQKLKEQIAKHPEVTWNTFNGKIVVEVTSQNQKMSPEALQKLKNWINQSDAFITKEAAQEQSVKNQPARPATPTKNPVGMFRKQVKQATAPTTTPEAPGKTHDEASTSSSPLPSR